MISDVVKCPHCDKKMKMSETPYLDKTLTREECKDCHISVAAQSKNVIELILRNWYCGQWDFDMMYINGEIVYARIGGGHRPLPTKEEK